MTEVRFHPPLSVPAVEVRGLRKTFRRKQGTGLRARKKPVPALHGLDFRIERGECVAILGQNGSGKSTLVRLLSTLLLHDGGSAHVFGHDVFKQPREVQRLVNRVSVEASFFKRLSLDREPELRVALLRAHAATTKESIPRMLRKVGFPMERRQRVDGGSLARDAAEGRARAGAAHLAGAAAARRADDRASTRARSSRCRTSSARCGGSTTRRSSSARTTSTRPRRSRSGSGSSTRAAADRLAPATS